MEELNNAWIVVNPINSTIINICYNQSRTDKYNNLVNNGQVKIYRFPDDFIEDCTIVDIEDAYSKNESIKHFLEI